MTVWDLFVFVVAVVGTLMFAVVAPSEGLG